VAFPNLASREWVVGDSEPLDDLLTETPAKRGKGRPQGSRNQVKVLSEPLKNARLQSLMEGCYPAETWLKKFRKLPDELQFRLRSMVEPKAKAEVSDSHFTLEVHGLTLCPRCGWRGKQESSPEKVSPDPPGDPELRLIGSTGNRISWEGEA